MQPQPTDREAKVPHGCSRNGWSSGLLAAAVIAAGCAPQTGDPQSTQGTASRVEWSDTDLAAMRSAVVDSARIWMVSGHIPGLVIAHVADGAVEWVEPIGVTRAGSATPVAANTVFEAASLGKPLFAYGVMKLAERGVIDLDAPLGRYLPDRIQGAARDSAVTVARVLSHSSGLDLNAAADGLEVGFDPGSRWAYSSVAYVILQRAIENVTGTTIEGWMKRDVFDPLGMTRTSYLAAMRSAEGHDRQGERLHETPWPQGNVASSLHTTAEDYAKFVAASLDAKAMWTSRVIADEAHDLHWGLGWGVTGSQPPVFLHWGSNPGFKSLAVGMPESRRGFVILTNSDNGLELATVLATRMIGRDVPALGFFMLHPTD
jgi:CubicO group peptidase (beta-lactamase class C family)